MSFQEKVKKHLGVYKSSKFNGLLNGEWTRTTQPKKLDYAFLPRDMDNNIVDIYKPDFLHYESLNKIKRHIYFHHMNSSQAMCFNFFYPLIHEKQLELITDFLGFKGESIVYDKVEFEKESEIDSKGGRRPTNFDFYFETASGKKLFFEIKYTEQEFGKAPKEKGTKIFDKEHIEKYNAVYKNELNAIKPVHQNIDSFLNNYQIMRNLIHLGDNSYVIFIYPNGNKKIKASAIFAKSDFVESKWIANYFPIDWEDIYDYVNTNQKIQKLNYQLLEFKEKYFIK